ncbi:translocation/assembly module TamB domain-containing protein [Olivibacter ginsenosidimutans]|uniref:Translocation/assembly module TamB domain-containing protein n=1 Tax=Olivibacter ginsenosidimutans TaxID=1176537 RepID=A0ABP9BSU7_9SPHI
MQTFLTQRLAAYFSRELHTTISIGGIYFKPFSSLTLKQVYVEDLDHDTLLYVDALQAKLNFQHIGNKEIHVNDLHLRQGTFHLKKKTDTTTNLSFISSYFSSSKSKKKSGGGLMIHLRQVSFRELSFSYKNYLAEAAQQGIDFNDIKIVNLSGELANIDVQDHLLKGDVKQLHFKEKSGFWLKQLDASVKIDSTSMEFKQLYAETNASKLGNYLRFNYRDIADFSDFINKVTVHAIIKDSRVEAKDIAFFAPSVNQIKFNIGINGHVSGKVNHFSGKQMLIKMGKATYFSGDVAVSGLPKIEQTIFTVNLTQFATNKGDAEPLLAGFSGNTRFQLPDFLESLGHISYTGKLSGYYNDFKTDGVLKTSLGEVSEKLAMTLKDDHTYDGSIQTSHFDLGSLLHQKQLGSAAFQATINGQGFNLAEIIAQVKADIPYLYYDNHRYDHLQFDGKVLEKVITGNLSVNDPKLMSSLTGEVDLKNQQNPTYELFGVVNKADLYKMGLAKDSVVVEGQINSNFRGNNLNNLVGNASITKVVLRKPNYSAAVDSMVLVAKGTDNDRTIAIESDILDATLNGEIDLNTFPAYFKSIAKRYLPSWDIDLNTGKQAFNFALRLKRSEPLFKLFAPSLHMPDTMQVNGKFSTADSIANLNAYIPLLEVGKLKIKDIILDEVAGNESLNLTLTADKVNITDSLYVENINISNILADDSLQFNVKLSDIDAKNQLDLNGLVEFKPDEAARLSLLPSNVKINQEDWQLEDKVNFDFHDGRAEVKGFELKNKEQLVKIDGVVSNREEDVLNVTFNRFNLATLDGVTNPLGIKLAGQLNGSFHLFSALKNPYASADINSSNIYYNDREIGDMTLLAEMNPETDLVEMDMEIKHQSSRTLKITGSYDAKATANSLNLKVTLEDSELVLFEPFLKKLVADLTGTVSADIRVRGTPWSPEISGDCDFKEASFTVNYLKTRYTINDQVRVNNSTIALHDLEIRDKDNNRAVADGSVDMSNPLDPVIDVQVKANHFMVLNTTAKDNPLYYGTAVGTGDFIFKGPTSNMDIDIKAATDEGTIFNIPLNASGTVSDNDFITFVSKDSTFSETKNSYFDGLTLHIDLDISRNAEANIFTDLGKLSGVGNGNIIMNITSLGDFEMFGDYVILQGKFTFTAQDFINKIFEISRGGTIRWTGNPSEALINLTAVYEVRTSVRPLYTAAGRAATDQRVLAQAEMILGGNLLHPEISFALDFPSDAYVKDELQNYFSDANNVNQQALSLIVRRSFSPGTGTDLTTELNSTFLSAGTELAFNQLNNVISQSLNLNFVDFNIRSFNEASASIRLLNNRLMLTGGVTDRRGELNDLNLFGNQVASDVEALYLIRKNGNLLFRASNRLNNRNFLNPNDEYVSAFGLVYRQEFDTLGEFFKRMFSLNKDKKKEEQEGERKSGQKEVSPKENTAPIKGKKVN